MLPHSDVAYRNCHFFLSNIDQDFNSFLKQNSNVLKDATLSLVISPQVSKNLFIDASLLHHPFAIVHNVFSSFYPYNHLFLWKNKWAIIPNLIRIVMRFAGNEQKKQQDALSKYEFYFTTSKEAYQYIQKVFPELIKSFGVAPISYFKTFSPVVTSNAEVTKWVIPGTVDVEVRDYDTVIAALQLSHFEIKSELILLGKVKNLKSKRVIEKLKKVCLQKGISITYYDDVVAGPRYDATLRNADFVVLPSKRYIREGISYAEVNKSGTSGTISDATRYALPCIYPDYISLPTQLSMISSSFSSATELSALLQFWINKRAYQAKKELRVNKNWNDLSPQELGKKLSEELVQKAQSDVV